MIPIVIKPGTEPAVGRAAGIIYAGVDEIYPIVGRYTTQHDTRGPAAWQKMKHKLEELAQRISPLKMPEPPYTTRVPMPTSVWQDWQVICDHTNNNPMLMDQGRIAVTIFIKPSRTVESCGGQFILARVLRDVEGQERPCMEVEYRPLRV